MKKYSIRHDKNEQKSALLADGKVALGVTVGAISTILAYLVFKMGSLETGSANSIEFVPIVVSLIVAFGSIFLAANALLEQRKTRQAATDPVLVVHLGQREDAKALVTFNISNIGAGAALNVHLSVDEPNDKIDRNLVTNIFKRHHPFSVILQGKSIEFSLAMGWELLADEPLPPFKARLLYEDLAGGEYESEFTIDVREMEGLGANKSPQMRIAHALEMIAEKTKVGRLTPPTPPQKSPFKR